MAVAGQQEQGDDDLPDLTDADEASSEASAPARLRPAVSLRLLLLVTVLNVLLAVGLLTLPAFVREEVLREANRAVDLSRYDLPVTVDAVTLRAGALDVRGIVR